MLSSVTLNCQVTEIVMNSSSQLSEMQSVSQMSHVTRIALWRCPLNVFVIVIVFDIVFAFVIVFFGRVLSPHHSDQMSLKVTSLWDGSLKVLSKCICLCHCLCLCHCICHCLCLCLCLCLFSANCSAQGRVRWPYQQTAWTSPVTLSSPSDLILELKWVEDFGW